MNCVSSHYTLLQCFQAQKKLFLKLLFVFLWRIAFLKFLFDYCGSLQKIRDGKMFQRNFSNNHKVLSFSANITNLDFLFKFLSLPYFQRNRTSTFTDVIKGKCEKLKARNIYFTVIIMIIHNEGCIYFSYISCVITAEKKREWEISFYCQIPFYFDVVLGRKCENIWDESYQLFLHPPPVSVLCFSLPLCFISSWISFATHTKKKNPSHCIELLSIFIFIIVKCLYRLW